jgi:hypothetical protein
MHLQRTISGGTHPVSFLRAIPEPIVVEESTISRRLEPLGEVVREVAERCSLHGLAGA